MSNLLSLVIDALRAADVVPADPSRIRLDHVPFAASMQRVTGVAKAMAGAWCSLNGRHPMIAFGHWSKGIQKRWCWALMIP